jgi:hypothetical protein
MSAINVDDPLRNVNQPGCCCMDLRYPPSLLFILRMEMSGGMFGQSPSSNDDGCGSILNLAVVNIGISVQLESRQVHFSVIVSLAVDYCKKHAQPFHDSVV